MNTIHLPQKQRGIATILVVLLAGTALTATVLGVSYAVRGAQDKTLSMHASTTAQARAWAGVELVRQYLKQETLATPPWTSLPWTAPITGISSGDLSAQVVAVSGPDASGHYAVTADITGAGAASTASLRTVYDVTPAVTPAGTSNGPNIDAANFYYDLNMTGGIVIKGGSNANFNVLGNVSLDSASIEGVNSIRATGNVSIGSGIKVNTIYGNGDVTLTGSSAITSVSALGNVYANSSGMQGVVNCNGAIVITNGSTGAINARGAVTASSGGTHGTINTNSTTLVTNGTIETVNSIGSVILSGGVVRTTNTMGSDTWTSTGAGATAINANGTVTYAASGGAINAIGDVILTGGGAGTVKSKGNVFVRSYGGISSLQCAGGLQVDQYASVTGTIGGLLLKLQQYNSGVNVSVIPGFSPPNLVSVALTPIAALQPYSLSRPTIDAYALKTSANYQFEYQLSGYTKITVSNVAGISGGEYALVSDASKKDFLCPLASFSAIAKTCAVSGSSAKTICQGYSPQNSCFSYTLNKWTIAGTSLAPGSMWFDGDLEVSSGTYFNSFIATGNIVTSGAHISKAVNTASYGAICNNTPTDGVTQTAYFAGLYPTNFCNVAAAKLTGDSLGNLAYVAGGWKAGLFFGGNITLGANTKTYGTVIAGNLFNSGGSTTVYGYVAAAGQGALGTNNLLGGSTTIDLTSLPATYSPTTLPCMSGCTPTAASTGDAAVLWSRYL